MKRILVLLLVSAMLVSLAGCGWFQILDGPGMVNEGNDQPTKGPESAAFTFSSTDVNGDPIAFSDFSGKKVVMLNLWETWCPPCVSEIPDLAELYEKYKDEGFVIIGAYSSSSDADVREMVKSLGITYPVMRATDSMEAYASQYVPTSVFFNGSGELISTQYIGSMSYSEWESVITAMLNK